MKTLTFTLGALAVAILGGSAQAQEPPTPIGSDFDYYSAQDQQSSSSPSDLAVDSTGGDASCGDKSSCGGCGGCGECDPCEAWTLFPEHCGYKIGGWIQAGYHNKSTGLFNKHPNRLNVHQFWLFAERTADGSSGWDWGFRGDVVYGVDAQDTQAFGNNPGRWDFQNGFDHGIYGWAIPQAYVELANGPLNIKVGHFFTIIGYEVVPATGNFFYSRAFTMNNSEPFTHTGALGTYDLGDGYTAFFGWTLGWDTGFDQINSGNNYIGGFSAPLTDGVTLTYASTAGNFGARSAGANGYMQSIVLNFELTDRLNYVFQSDWLDTDIQEDDIGINQYLFYTLNDCWKFGTRIEWWKDDGVSHYEATGGINWMPTANVRLRPEVRQQWIPNMNFDETIFGIDAIVTF